MSQEPAFFLWVALALALGFGIGWLVVRKGNLDHNQANDQIRALLAHEAQSARQELRDNLDARMKELREAQARVGKDMQEKIDGMRRSGDEKIEKIRQMVSEKLQETLTERIGASFKSVDDSLQKVHQGLGAMRDLAKDVGGLKSVLAGVRTRGLHAEFQLEAQLEEAFLPSQYRKNVQLGSGRQVVEFAICLPNSENEREPLFLPLDSKLPLDPYTKLREAQENAEMKGEIEEARKAFLSALRSQAREISKYVSPPETTDFALMYLPFEGMYAEALRSDAWLQIRKESNVVIVGPTTLYALLHSLQLGFKSLAISERSTEVWNILQAVSKEFKMFNEVIDRLAKQIETAGRTVSSVNDRSQKMQRRLDAVSVPEEIGEKREPNAGSPSPSRNGD